MLIRLGNNAYAGLGYNGRGITMATMMGKQLSLVLTGQATGIALKEQKRTSFIVYSHAVKTYNENELTLQIVAATLTEDPGNVHISFRTWDKPDVRKGAEEDIARAEALLWAEGRKVEGEKRQTISEILSYSDNTEAVAVNQ